MEKTLGRPLMEGCYNCKYLSANEEVLVHYSESPCKGFKKGWNVPTDTVVSFTVYPKNELKIAIDEFKSEKLFFTQIAQ